MLTLKSQSTWPKTDCMKTVSFMLTKRSVHAFSVTVLADMCIDS